MARVVVFTLLLASSAAAFVSDGLRTDGRTKLQVYRNGYREEVMERSRRQDGPTLYDVDDDYNDNSWQPEYRDYPSKPNLFQEKKQKFGDDTFSEAPRDRYSEPREDKSVKFRANDPYDYDYPDSSSRHNQQRKPRSYQERPRKSKVSQEKQKFREDPYLEPRENFRPAPPGDYPRSSARANQNLRPRKDQEISFGSKPFPQPQKFRGDAPPPPPPRVSREDNFRAGRPREYDEYARNPSLRSGEDPERAAMPKTFRPEQHFREERTPPLIQNDRYSEGREDNFGAEPPMKYESPGFSSKPRQQARPRNYVERPQVKQEFQEEPYFEPREDSRAFQPSENDYPSQTSRPNQSFKPGRHQDRGHESSRQQQRFREDPPPPVRRNRYSEPREDQFQADEPVGFDYPLSLIRPSQQVRNKRDQERAADSGAFSQQQRIREDPLPPVQRDRYVEPRQENFVELRADNPIGYDFSGYTNQGAQPKNDPERTIAAGLGTGVLGMLLGGPVGAAVLGFTSAYAAENMRENTIVGDSARAIGEVAIAARNNFVDINEKHRVVDRTVMAAEDAWEKAKELDREYRLVQQAKDVTLYGSAATVDFVRQNNVLEKSVHSLGKSIGWVSEKVAAGSLDAGEGIRSERRRRDASMPPPSLRSTEYGQTLMPSRPYSRDGMMPRQENFQSGFERNGRDGMMQRPPNVSFQSGPTRNSRNGSGMMPDQSFQNGLSMDGMMPRDDSLQGRPMAGSRNNGMGQKEERSTERNNRRTTRQRDDRLQKGRVNRISRSGMVMPSDESDPWTARPRST